MKKGMDLENLRKEIQELSETELQDLELVRNKLKAVLEKCIEHQAQSRILHEDIQVLLDNIRPMQLPSQQVRSDLLLTINLCLHVLSEKSSKRP